MKRNSIRTTYFDSVTYVCYLRFRSVLWPFQSDSSETKNKTIKQEIILRAVRAQYGKSFKK